MIKSMTGFSRQESTQTWGALIMEVRSVNSRYLDVNMRVADELRSIESALREKIQKSLTRGKVDLSIRYQAVQQQSDEITLNLPLIDELAKAMAQISERLDDIRPVSPIEILRWPAVQIVPEVGKDVVQAAAMSLLDAAMKDVISMRQSEGEKIKIMIETRCDAIEEYVLDVRKQVPEIKANWLDRVKTRLAEVASELDEGRLEQELAYMSQKMDVDEELDRLDAHIAEIRKTLGESKPVGRRLDFLMQELNREANTLSSKSVHTQTTNAAVELKVLIEQMREQIQNIE